MKVTLPSAELVSRNFSDLLGRTFVAKAAPAAIVPKATDKWAVARYGTPGEATWVYWLVDLQAAAGLGAALSLIPAGAAQSAAKDGKFSEVLLDNFREVMNVGSSILRPVEGRVVLQDVLMSPQPSAAEMAKWLAGAKARLDVTTTLQGYEGGRMLLLNVPA